MDGYFGCMLYEFHNSPVKETKNDRDFASYRPGLHFTEKEIERENLLSVTHVTKNTVIVTFKGHNNNKWKTKMTEIR